MNDTERILSAIADLSLKVESLDKKIDKIEDRINKYDAVEIISAVRNSQEEMIAKIENIKISTASIEAVKNLRMDIAQGLREAEKRIEKTA